MIIKAESFCQKQLNTVLIHIQLVLSENSSFTRLKITDGRVDDTPAWVGVIRLIILVRVLMSLKIFFEGRAMSVHLIRGGYVRARIRHEGMMPPLHGLEEENSGSRHR